jgi:large subunit ribosomal protein L25
MKHPVLKAEERKILGKKIKTLRREGILPGNVYGKGLPSKALQVALTDFEKAHKEAGDTGIIDLQLDGKSHPVLVKNLQMNFRSHTPLHADFYQVNMKEKVKAVVPVVTVGEPKAVADKIGMLMQPLSEVEIEALPDKLAEKIEVDVEHLAALDDHILVSDLKAPEGVAILTDPSQTVAKIAELVAPEPEPEPEAEAAEGEEGAAPAEGAEGEGATEGEKPAEEGDKPAEEKPAE